MALFRKLCGGTRHEEETEAPRAISQPTNSRWHGGMRPCRRTPSTDSDIRRRDFAQGIAVDETIHIEVIRPATPPSQYVLPAVDANIVKKQHGEFAALDALSRGKPPCQGPVVPPRGHDDPKLRYLVAPWEAPDFQRPTSTISARTVSKRGSRAEQERSQKNRGSMNLSRFSWTSSEGEEALATPALTSNTVAAHDQPSADITAVLTEAHAVPPAITVEQPTAVGADRPDRPARSNPPSPKAISHDAER